jgi:hypothetical protein
MASSATITKEFLIPNVIPSSWFEDLKRVWNECLDLLYWLQHYNRVKKNNAFDLPRVAIKVTKNDKDWVYYCDRVRDFRIDKKKSWDVQNIEQRVVLTLVPEHWLTPPPITNFSSIELKKPFAKKRCEWLQSSSIPATFVNDFIELVVCAAWESYQKGKRGKPKYKRANDKIICLPTASLRGQWRFKGGDLLRIPGLNDIKVRGLRNRLTAPIKAMTEGMKSNPENYTRLADKIQKLKLEKANKLIKADDKNKKDLSAEEIGEYLSKISDAEMFEKAIAFFSKPGSARIVLRDNKTYLQITAEMPITASATDKTVGVDTGLDLLAETTSGLKVKHQNFVAQMARVDTLKQKLSKMQRGSNNYNKLSSKINKIQGKIARNKKAYQGYWAQQIADVNGSVAVKKVRIAEAIENPLPIATKEGNYIKNGKAEARIKNRELHDCAIGQFIASVAQQCHKKSRNFVLIDIEPESTVQEVLEVADFPQVRATSGKAQNPSGTREGRNPNTIGKPKATDSNTLKVPSEVPKSKANPPVPSGKPRKNKKRQNAIG